MNNKYLAKDGSPKQGGERFGWLEERAKNIPKETSDRVEKIMNEIEANAHPDTVEQAAKEYENIEIKELGIEGLKDFQKKVKFGDIIINGYASLANPHRTGIFVKALNNVIVCTDGKGNFYEPCLDRKAKLLIVGNVLAGSKW